jgi:hypothetical protein
MLHLREGNDLSISAEERFFNSLFPERDTDNLETGVRILRKGLFGLLAPLATALILPKDCVKNSTIRLVS